MAQEQTTPQVTPQEFAAKIKTKYPAYASVPDDQLVEKITAKYPQYKSQIKQTTPDPVRGATQATGLSADTRSSVGRVWDEVKRGLTSAQAGQGLKPQPTMTANVAQFAGMAGDVAAQLGGAVPGAGAASSIEKAAFEPTVKMVPVVSKLLDAQGNPIVREVEEIGASAAGRAAGLTKEGIKNILKWMNNHKVESYVMFKTAEQLGLAPEKAVKMLHVASK
jgi:hypothetical protein